MDYWEGLVDKIEKQEWEKFLLTLYWDSIDNVAVAGFGYAQITVSWKQLRRMELEHGIKLKVV